MVKQLIVVSGPGQRLTMDVARGAVRSAPAIGDDYTYLEVNAAPPPATLPPTRAGGLAPEPPRPWDITMGFVAGLPPGVEPLALRGAAHVTGTITLADLARHLDAAPSGGRIILMLGSDANG